MENTYKNIVETTTDQFKDRGSRFIGFLFPIASTEEIKNHLAALKKEYYDATHHCYAYTLGHLGEELIRLNDDGEPSGSAARPIFGQLQSAELKDVLAVVIRYFGGTKLGVPGLINAYKTTTRLAIEKAHIEEKQVMMQAQLRFPYDRMNVLMTLLKKEGGSICGMDYENECSVISFCIPNSRFFFLEEKIHQLPYANLSNCNLL